MSAGPVAVIGFGEAGSTFAPRLAVRPRIYDSATDEPTKRGEKVEQARALGHALSATNREAVEGAFAILSLVTADRAVAAAAETAHAIGSGCLYLDMNSAAPATKRHAAEQIVETGGRYVDVAVMAPMRPACLDVPLLLSGDHADEGADVLRHLGFTAVRVVAGDVGRASSIKMICSVVVKGIEALTAESVLAAAQAGVLDEVLASLDASPPPPGWAARADYNLDRMMVHGLRRAAEMAEVARTLDALGSGSAMSRATAAWHRELGSRQLLAEGGLSAKIAALIGREAKGETA